MKKDEPIWTRITDREEFCRLFADRRLKGNGMEFTIFADGRMEGLIGNSELTGRWHWEDGFFCRTARLDGEDLGTDWEVIETDGVRMRYVRDKGRGEGSIVS